MLSDVPPAASMKSLRLRNIASACSSGSDENRPVLASLPEIAEEKTMLPMTTPMGIGAPCSMPCMRRLFRFAMCLLLTSDYLINFNHSHHDPRTTVQHAANAAS